MTKKFRAVTRYTFTYKSDPDKKIIKNITVLVDDKSLDLLKKKILEQHQEEIKILKLTVEWKNWWGAAS